MHGLALEQILRPYREKTRHSDWLIWSLALHVLFCPIEDLLGTRLEVRLAPLDHENPHADRRQAAR